MKLFIDTNVILDVLAGREPFFRASASVLNLCELGKAEGAASTLTFCTASYVLRKNLKGELMKSHLRSLRNICRPIDLTASVINKAIDSDIADFEDAVQFFSAVYCSADYIITRNTRDFPRLDNLPVITPADFLALELKF